MNMYCTSIHTYVYVKGKNIVKTKIEQEVKKKINKTKRKNTKKKKLFNLMCNSL